MSKVGHIIFPRNFGLETNAANVGGFTRRPVGMTYQQCVDTLFGVRVWRFQMSASGTYTPAAGGGSWSFSENFTLNHGMAGSSAPGVGFADEEGMVVYSVGALGYGETISGVTRQVLLYSTTFGEARIFTGGVYYPDIAVVRNNSIGQPDMRIGVPPNPLLILHTFSGTFLGLPVASYLEGSSGVFASVTSANFTVTADALWSYT